MVGERLRHDMHIVGASVHECVYLTCIILPSSD